ncbi:MAG: hypothetical protein N2517_01155 [Ignavibacteria bacterium]|nr:hypothetical protein [Ignavibacteria bacterium]
MIKFFFCFLVFYYFSFVQIETSFSQVENVPTSNPVYSFLKRLQIQGILKNVSFFRIPFTRGEVVEMLKLAKDSSYLLSTSDLNLLNTFLSEFDIIPEKVSVLIPSETDSLFISINDLFSEKDKYIYKYQDVKNSVSAKPLGSLRFMVGSDKEKNENSIYGNLGFRVYGTIDSVLGYFLQVTNGKFFSGSRRFGIREDKTLAHSVKFTLLDSDFDLVESHVRFQYKWFYTGISRETRFLGSGVNQTIVVSDNAPPMDEFFLGVKFQNFRYCFSHFSLISQSKTDWQYGVNADIPPKYLVLHTATLLLKNFNLTYFETIVYSGRSVELAYLNPFTFLKSVEHSLHDRDKTTMGLSFEWNPLPSFQILGTWMLEDLVISEIGKNFWGNKTAWNIGSFVAFPFSTNIGVEYTRVEPYMFTHFNRTNNRTNDGKLFGTYLYPNSDELSVSLTSYLLGSKYPLNLRVSYQRHGANVTDDSGKVIRNVGGDFNYTRSGDDSYRVKFLDGIRKDLFRVQVGYGFELFRNLNLQLFGEYRKQQNLPSYFLFKVFMRFEDF